jgi:hypothetical protein
MRSPLLNIREQGHKAEVHVQLLVAVEQGEAGIVGNEVDLGFLVSAHHHNVFHHAGGWLSGDPREFEAVPMQMNRVDVITRIAHANAVALPLMQMEGRRRHHLLYGVRHSVDGPLIESVERGVLLFEEHVEHFVGRRGGGAGIAEVRVVRHALPALRLPDSASRDTASRVRPGEVPEVREELGIQHPNPPDGLSSDVPQVTAAAACDPGAS